MRRARRPRMLGATTKAMPVSIVLGAKAPCDEAERRPTRGPDRTRALRGSAIGLPPRRRHLDRGTAPVALTAARPQGWRACVSPLMRAHVSGPPADVAVFMATSTKGPFRNCGDVGEEGIPMQHSSGFLKLVNDAKSPVREISVEEVRAKQERNESFSFVDVREDTEWSQGHAAGAMHLGKGVIERDIEGLIP